MSSKLIPITDWTRHGYPWPSENGWRWAWRNRAYNGVGICLKKISGRLVVDEERYPDWARSQDQEQGHE